MQIQPPGPETRVYSPHELNREVRVHLEAGFPRLWLAAEISNLARPGSGHWYFTLKDERAQVRCAMFRGDNRGVAFRPANGDRVLVRGRLSLYEARGEYQLITEAMLEAGTGALQQAFEALKKKLGAEGLFAPEIKQPLPGYPGRIAVVTSPTGAAVRDIVETLKLRWPAARVRIYPAQVQGESAPASLVRALKAAEAHRFAEVIILARGGGSLEDLWAFNDETVARTIHALNTPVISGVGHETDFTMADFVADQRAATPTAAAQAATPDGPALKLQIRRLDQRLRHATRSRIQQWQQKTDYLARRLDTLHPRRRLAELETRRADLDRRLHRHMQLDLAGTGERLGNLHTRLGPAVRTRMERASSRLSELARALHAVSPLAVLGRGYGLVRDADGRVLSQREDFEKDKLISILIRDFQVISTVNSVADSDLPGDKPPTKSAKPG